MKWQSSESDGSDDNLHMEEHHAYDALPQIWHQAKNKFRFLSEPLASGLQPRI